jgi:hypothetical protein
VAVSSEICVTLSFLVQTPRISVTIRLRWTQTGLPGLHKEENESDYEVIASH